MSLDILKAYRMMLLIRGVETAILDGIKTGVFPGTTHACIGQEAVAVGAMFARTANNAVFSNHRGHGHILASGIGVEPFLAELAGLESGVCAGRGGSQHIAEPSLGFMGSNGITGGQVPVAVGYALANKLRGNEDYTFVFFGDGAINQGAVLEAFNMAAIWGLNVLFLCENNRYSMSASVDRMIKKTISDRAASFGINATSVYGMDVETVYDFVSAVPMLPSGGPVLLEFSTYRYCGHSKSDQCLYRTGEELAEWKSIDPIPRAERSLLSTGVTADEISMVKNSVSEEIAGAMGRLGLKHG